MCNFGVSRRRFIRCEFPLVSNKWTYGPFFQLAALVEVIAASQGDSAALVLQPLALLLVHAHGFASPVPGCVDIPQSTDLNVHGDHCPSRIPAPLVQLIVLAFLSDVCFIEVLLTRRCEFQPGLGLGLGLGLGSGLGLGLG